MSRRNAGAGGQPARHAGERLVSTLGAARPGLLAEGPGQEDFEYRGPAEPGGTGTESVSTQSGNAHTGNPQTGSLQAGSTGRDVSAPRLRWRVGLRVAVLLAAAALAAGAWFWWQAAAATPDALPLGGTGTEAVRTSEAMPAGAAGDGRPAPEESSRASPSGGLVVVHVAGAVGAPGVVRLPQGSRVDDAIAAAGGPAAGAAVDRLNLALVLEDGQKIYVPTPGESLPEASGTGTVDSQEPGTTPPGSTQAGGKINLNTASVAELDTLPKVGPVLAQRIVDWRKDHGPFKSVEELDAVDGVGPKMLESLLPLVTV